MDWLNAQTGALSIALAVFVVLAIGTALISIRGVLR